MTGMLAIVILAGSTGLDAYQAEIAAAVADAARVYPVPPALVRAIIRQESGFNPRARSRAGAVGLMQLMPFSAEKVGLGDRDLWDPATNILAGARLLAVLLKHYEGDLISALVAYNAGPRPLGAPLPPNGETPGYVAAVLGYYYREYSTARGAQDLGPDGPSPAASDRLPPLLGGSNGGESRSGRKE
jgi:soluble lytic murein transglycosylase-like protein